MPDKLPEALELLEAGDGTAVLEVVMTDELAGLEP